jgi:serine/threonine-protein kinase
MAAAGDKISGFTLVRQLGAGGMGETWEAVRQVGADFEQRVAIKVVDPNALDSEEGLSLFRREASLAASLRHPNIASVLDVDEERGAIVCELVDGADLRAVLRASFKGKLRPPLLVYFIGQMARGLSHAHRRVLHGQLSPVVHRDMSPGNVVADYDGNLKIVDFGIAKAIASADISETIKGKLSYMAPEQAMATRIDGRADQYALGVMTYEAAAGVRPNDGAHDGETLANILSGRHLPIGQREPSLPPELCQIIERMLSVQPEQRFPTMDAVVEALDPFTPPLSIHRELAQLVLRARPARTIVKHNGQYISQPVAEESLRRERTPARDANSNLSRTLRDRTEPVNALAATESFRPDDLYTPRTDTLIAQNVVPMGPALGTGEPSSATKPPGRFGARPALFAAAGAITFGLLSFALMNSGLTAGPDDARGSQLAPAASQPGQEVTPPSGALGATPSSPAASLPPSAAITTPPPAAVSASSPPSAAVPPAPSRASSAAGDAPEPGARAANARAPSSSEALARSPRARRSAREAGESATAPSASPANRAKIRVKVFPWGRVWVDGKLQGSVPPILEVVLSPGLHEIAVGHERPVETRSVTLEPAATQLVSFDLEGR